MVAGEGAGSADADIAGFGLGRGKKFLDILVRAGLQHGQSQRRALEQSHRDDLLGGVAGLLLHRLQDDMGDVDPCHEIAVRLGAHQFAPSQSAAAADLVIDDDLLAEDLFEDRLLPAGFPVGLTARIEGHQIGEGLGGIGFLLSNG